MRRASMVFLALAGATLVLPAEAQRGWRRPDYRLITLSQPPTPGRAHEVSVLVDAPYVLVSQVVIRRGTKLPEQRAKYALTVHTLSGTGVLYLGRVKRLPLYPTRMIVLAPRTRYAIKSYGRRPLVLLLHEIKAAPSRRAEVLRGIR